VAYELGISFDKVRVTATNTSKVPNTSPTAASSGTDMNGMAAKDAVNKIMARIAKIVSKQFHCKASDIAFRDEKVLDTANPNNSMSFNEAVHQTYMNRESLSSTGFYKTPGVHFDREKGRGNPFYYFAFGMSVTEVEVDTLTGAHKLLRTDIIHDAGESINPALDIGQVEGAYIQGVGWCTSEELKHDAKGNLLNHSPDTYKIPGINDIPEIFNVDLLQGAPNPNTIRRSKAVGEPPFMLAFSAWLAIQDAIAAVADHQIEPDFAIPATNELIVLSAHKLRHQA
jgi:xanthine dehydrogenase molybdopterin-binding subunit B